MRQALRVLDPVRRAMREKFHRVVAEVVAGEVNRASDRIVHSIQEFERRSRRDLFAAGERDATVTSARVVRDMMRSAKMLPNPVATLEYGLSLAPDEGMALEFGVYSGSTLTVIAKARKGRGVYGFDSFEGLPEHGRAGFRAGTFGGDMLPMGRPNVPGAELVAGWFADTLPKFLASHPGPVAFVHVDADLYSSARTVLDHVGPRLRPGSVIVFDEFFNYPGWEDGEYRAWEDHVKNTGWRYCYEAFTVDNEQVVIRLTDVDSVSMVGDYAADAAIVHHQFDPEPALDDTVAGGNGQMTENADK